MPTQNELAKIEHEKAQAYVRDAIRKFDSPEALRALTAVVALLRIFAGSLWDGVNGLHPERMEQGRIDATVMADMGTAIEEHIKAHKR